MPIKLPNPYIPDQDSRRNFERLATDLGDIRNVLLGLLQGASPTALPSDPIEGQLTVVNPETTIHWLLRWDGTRWVFLGGQPIFDQVGAAESTSSTTFVDLTTTGPSIAIPFDGDYRISHGCSVQTNAAAVAVMSYDFGSGAVDADAVVVGSENTVNALDSCSRTQQEGSLTDAMTLTSKYRTSAGTSNFRRRWLTISPIFLTG